MAKYDWIKLKHEYILGDYKSLKNFADTNKIPYNGYFKKNTAKWNEEKRLKRDQKETKIIEKTIDKISDRESDRIARVLTLSDRLADKIEEAIEQLNLSFVTQKTKTKIIEYNEDFPKPTKEVIEEIERIEQVETMIDRLGLQKLTTALKDIKDIQKDASDSISNGEEIKIIDDVK